MKEKQDLVGFENHEYRPFIRENTKSLLIKLLQKHQPQKVLEIGTFLGYSASIILETLPNCSLKTIEKDKQKSIDAQKNLSVFAERVEVINLDAIEFLQSNTEKFDFIFLDGAKGQYYKYLPFLEQALNIGGVLLTDDVLFYGLVNSDQKIEHKHRTIVNNLRKYLQMLQDNPNFKTEIFDFDDGVSVSVKIK